MRLSFSIPCALACVVLATFAPAVATPAEVSLPAPKLGHAKPLVVILAENAGTETTDFVIPYAVLKDAGVAEVVSVATGPGPVKLMPTMTVLADETIAQFRSRHPEGADLIIVPYLMDSKDNAVTAFLKDQYARRASVMSICVGARSVAEAGLFDGRRATSHWSELNSLQHNFKAVHWVRDRRYVQDGRVISTAGVTASIPASLALVEAMAGRPAALAEAARLGVADWGVAHRTGDFSPTAGDATQALENIAAIWGHESVEAPASEGFDEMALALRTDAWSRTMKTKVVITGVAGPVWSRHGLALIADARSTPGVFVIPAHSGGGAAQLDRTLADMDRRYGAGTTRLATLGLEYPRR